ncbi:hypothetical protein [Streptomyces sp. NPDC000880]
MNSAERDQASTVSEDPHDVTVRDQLWLILAAVIPFAAATLWYLLSR